MLAQRTLGSRQGGGTTRRLASKAHPSAPDLPESLHEASLLGAFDVCLRPNQPEPNQLRQHENSDLAAESGLAGCSSCQVMGWPLGIVAGVGSGVGILDRVGVCCAGCRAPTLMYATSPLVGHLASFGLL